MKVRFGVPRSLRFFRKRRVLVVTEIEHAYRDSGARTADGRIKDGRWIPSLEPGPRPLHFLLESIPSSAII